MEEAVCFCEGADLLEYALSAIDLCLSLAASSACQDVHIWLYKRDSVFHIAND